ncbi:Gfo/Idh/MocA family protein [Pedobacter insulae]|uniref:Predicted dehydrogenase n=1 Tax=Pedobacter insulae TaxID=414048 RepID=A0A1I2WGU3_9SPHI|nr:Gfo/Idh/MocA family oxidoreductase [Pedobacter insulae]SFH00545.1 Predicted dehydrogenase [Pedobacter insulae]
MNKERVKDNFASRRNFIKSAGILTAFTIIPRHVLGGVGYLAPSDQVSLGFIGVGRQGVGLKNSFIGLEKARIVAASDVYGRKLKSFAEQANEYYAKKNNTNVQKSCQEYLDFREILERKDIDAVVIALPDHWHAAAAVRAAAAGKDIYCEKPLSLSIAEGRAMVEAARKYNRVFQTGSMQRSWAEFRQTANIMRNGLLGDIKSIKVSVGAPPVPYDLPKQDVPADLDWNRWLGPNEYVHYNSRIAPNFNEQPAWADWRLYKGIGGGMVTDWGAHMFDIVQWGLAMDMSGPVAFNPPSTDNKYLNFTYANGIQVSHENFGISNAIQIIGSKGKLEVQRGKLVTDPVSLKDYKFGESDKQVYFSQNHYQDFLDAVQTRGNTVAPVETGHRTATVCNLANIAYELGRPLKWNPEKEKFIDDKEANKLIGRQLKKEWKV